MLRTYVYLPEELEEKIDRAVAARKTSKAKVIRDAIERGIVETDDIGRKASIDVLFKLTELGKKYWLKGPRDGSGNMDKYLWDKWEI